MLSWDSVLMNKQRPSRLLFSFSWIGSGWGHIHTDKSFHALPVEYFTLNYNLQCFNELSINFYIYRFSFIILEKENC